jgi:aminopeptidase
VGESSFDRWASVLVDYSTEVATGDQVAISGGVAAEPLLRAIYRAVLRKGGLPVLLPSFGEAQADLFTFASDEQLAYISPLERWMREEATVSIDVSASTNTRALSAVDPSRQSVWTRARAELRQTAFARAARGERRWSSTIFPTPAHAQDADMATDEFAAFLEAA